MICNDGIFWTMLNCFPTAGINGILDLSAHGATLRSFEEHMPLMHREFLKAVRAVPSIGQYGTYVIIHNDIIYFCP